MSYLLLYKDVATSTHNTHSFGNTIHQEQTVHATISLLLKIPTKVYTGNPLA